MISNKSDEIRNRYSDGNIVGILPSPYDERDYKFKELVPLGAITIPREYESPNLHVFDQGKTNMCGPCSFSVLRYMQEEEQSHPTEPFSPAFTYANRPVGEDFEGMYLRSICKKGLEGTVPYHEFPGFYTYAKCKYEFQPRKEELLKKAAYFKISKYYKCTNREQTQSAIIATKGVMVGVPTYDSLIEPDSNGIVNYDPAKDTKDYGGHCVLLVGWKKINSKFYWILHNSWGKDYGINGRVYIPENYPWIDSPYAVVDNEIEITYTDYMRKFKNKEKKKETVLGISNFFSNIFKKG